MNWKKSCALKKFIGALQNTQPLEDRIWILSPLLLIVICFVNDDYLWSGYLFVGIVGLIILYGMRNTNRIKFKAFDIRQSVLCKKSMHISQMTPKLREQENWCPDEIIKKDRADIIEYINNNRDKEYHCVTHYHFYHAFEDAFGADFVIVKKCYNDSLESVRKKYNTERCQNCAKKDDCRYYNCDETKIREFCGVTVLRK